MFAASAVMILAPVAAQVPDPIAPVPMQTVQSLDDAEIARAAFARGDAAEALSRWLRVLAKKPDDVAALTAAGQAALVVGDLNAASGFFGRAEQRAPTNGAIKAGIASILTRQGDARGALRSFRAAAALGVPAASIAADRGMAYDLRGEPKRAQADYLIALQARPGDAEIIKRLALSQAIGGEQAAALATLDPLLRNRDASAWRTRMFARAVAGDVSGATADAGLILNAVQAAAIAPYFTRLAGLKPAEKAAAVFLGKLPAAPRPVQIAAPVPAAPPPAVAAVVAAPLSAPAASPALVDYGTIDKPVTAPAARTARRESKRDAVAATRKPPAPVVEEAAVSSVDADAAAVRKSAPAAARIPRSEAKRESAADARKREAEETAKRSPTRYWAQVAGGANRRDLPRAWAALKTKWPRQLAGRSPSTMHYRYTNRLLIGPFATSGAAQSWVNERREEGLASFMVTTPAGTEVEPLD